MPISQSTVTLRNGQPSVDITVPFGVPAECNSGSTFRPHVDNLSYSIALSGGTILGLRNLYYYFVPIDANGKYGKPSRPLEVLVPSGTNTNKVTISGINPFDSGAANYEVYLSLDDPWSPGRISGPTAAPALGATFTFTDTGSTPSSTIIPDDSYQGANLYWKLHADTTWRFAVSTADRSQTILKFTIPYNVNGQQIDIQLRAVSIGVGEQAPEVATVATYTVTGVLGATINLGGIITEWQIGENSGNGNFKMNGTDAFDTNVRLASTFRNNAVDAFGIPGSGLTLSQTGTSTTIVMASGTMPFGSGTVAYNSASIAPGYGTWYIYFDDPAFAGGTVTLNATASLPDIAAARGRVYVGKITTSSGGGGSGGGGVPGGGGKGGTY